MILPRDHVLRCVATPRTGLGHAVRALTLARHLPGAILAVDVDTAATLKAMARDLPPVQVLHSDDGAWIDWYDRAPHVILDTQFSGNAGATAAEAAVLKQRGCPVTVIDSMPPDHFGAQPGGTPDILVTPYIGAAALRPTPAAGQWLHGPRFAILPAELVATRDASRFPEAPRILVVCGGSDPDGMSARIVDRLRDVSATIDVVVGPMFTDTLRAELAALASADTSVHLIDAPTSLVALYQSATLVVGRAGLTRYEAACLGRNGIYLSQGSAYSAYYDGFTRSGVAEIHVGASAAGEAAFFDRLAGLRDPAKLAAVSRINVTAYQTVDGQGAARVAQAITRRDAEEAE